MEARTFFQSRFLTEIQVAEILNLSAGTLANRRYARRPLLPFHQIGGKRGPVRYSIEAVQAAIEAMVTRIAPTETPTPVFPTPTVVAAQSAQPTATAVAAPTPLGAEFGPGEARAGESASG